MNSSAFSTTAFCDGILYYIILSGIVKKLYVGATDVPAGVFIFQIP